MLMYRRVWCSQADVFNLLLSASEVNALALVAVDCQCTFLRVEVP
jgi:hypothetical protein